MTIENYLKEVSKNLYCDKKKRQSICKDLQSDIEIALENHESWQDIEERLGAPKQVANEFNENLGFQKRVLPIWIFITIAVVFLTSISIIYFITKQPDTTHPNASIKQEELGTSGMFTKQEINTQSQNIVELAAKQEYDTIIKKHGNALLQKSITAKQLLQVANQIDENFGDFQKITSQYYTEVTDTTGTYAVTELVALYTNRSVTYRLSFDQDMKLAGIYMK